MIKRNLCLLALLLPFAACSIGGTSPEPEYFALAPSVGPVMADVHYAIKVQRPLMAGYLDRPEIVRQDSDYEVQIDDGKHWAEPLDAMFERVLLQDLQQRLPGATILDEDTGALAEPRVTLATDIQQFNRIAHGQVALEAELLLKDNGTHDQPPPHHVTYSLDASSSSPQDLSALIGKLADGIATLLHNQLVQGNKIVPKIQSSTPE